MARTTIRTEDITASEVTTAKMATDPTNASNLSSGSVPSAQLGNVDTASLRNDIATLALHSAIADNKAAFNLTNDFIDQFEDSSGIDTTTNAGRDSAEWVGSITGYGGVDSNTKLLLHMDGADDGLVFRDSSTNARNTWTAVGDVHTDTTIKKIGTASAQFDGVGTGDYLHCPGRMLSNQFGANDFTMEFWMYATDVTSRVVFEQGTNSSNTFQFWLNSSSKMEIYLDDNGSSWAFNTASNTSIVADTWTHIALVHKDPGGGGTPTIKLFIDGTLDSNFASTTFQTMHYNTSNDVYIGQSRALGSGDGFEGYLDELRVSSTARYDANFTPSTTAFDNDIDTCILLHFDGADGGTSFPDSATGFAINRSGTATKTGVKKFGTASAYFDGSDYLSAPDSDDWNFGSGDFTLDCWLRMPDVTWSQDNDITTIMGQSGTTSLYTVLYWIPSSNSSNDNGFNFYAKTSGGGEMFNYAPDTNDGVVNDTWYHIAVVRNGSNWTTYKDGEVYDSRTGSDTLVDWSYPFIIGALGSSYVRDFKGYIDELRVSKGIARTTDSNDPMYISSGTSFTPPTQAYDELSVNATGNFTSTNQTASASVSKMGIVVLYKNAAGTATLNTDITAELSANGGSNYASATLLDRGTFSSGIKMAVANDVSVTAGTSCKYKISFANQANSSKETQVHGVALLY